MRKSKSRTFAVILTPGNTLTVDYLWLEKDVDTFEEKLVHHKQNTPWIAEHKNVLVELLKKGGITARFYDPEEKQWLDDSLNYGYVAAPGPRDGQWGMPSLEEFKTEYLATV